MVQCNKCDGKGFIGGFSHVAQGVCFQCKGSGKLVEPKKATVSYSRAFICQYYDPQLFPEGMETITPIKVLCNPGHITAEGRLIFVNDIYYVGKPVCRASGYYKIPANEYDTFVTHYNKVHKDFPL